MNNYNYSFQFFKKDNREKKITIKVKYTNITDEPCNILVNSCQDNLGEGSGVHGAIRKAAGNRYINECSSIMEKRREKKLDDNEFVITCAGNINTVNEIFNIRAPRYTKNNIYDITYNKTFDYIISCYKYNNKTIVMPTFGTGVFGTPIKISLKSLLKSLKKRLKIMIKNSVDKITIVSYNKEEIKEIKNIIKNKIQKWKKKIDFKNYEFHEFDEF